MCLQHMAKLRLNNMIIGISDAFEVQAGIEPEQILMKLLMKKQDASMINWKSLVVHYTKPVGRIEIGNVLDVAYQNKVAIVQQQVDAELKTTLEHPQHILEEVSDDEIMINVEKEINVDAKIESFDNKEYVVVGTPPVTQHYMHLGVSPTPTPTHCVCLEIEEQYGHYTTFAKRASARLSGWLKKVWDSVHCPS
ncbi:hypothetical protein H5410_026940 [Solanum commersonii]|uniref:Uncharacterized protein n=1 Tax=Solanum commersonii TaxID=4109 RepID=A0A9J5Z0C3_SOLCO|nr:hypothetical protein H5410_026940 [Solanum commersonii]